MGRPFSLPNGGAAMPSFLPGLPEALIVDALKRSPGNEIRSGKFDSPESSAALVANGFGWFLQRPTQLPPLPGVPAGQVSSVELEAEMRFPWTGGRHPWLDVAIETHTTLIGIESKRYEPFRPLKQSGFAEVIDRPIWGEKLAAFTRLRDALVAGDVGFESRPMVFTFARRSGPWGRFWCIFMPNRGPGVRASWWTGNGLRCIGARWQSLLPQCAVTV